MNHTPGQWQATEMGSEGWAVFIPHPSSKRGILMMLASNLTETHARLIASAPELDAKNKILLAALEEIAVYENLFNLYFDKSAGYSDDMRAIARDAIATANKET